VSIEGLKVSSNSVKVNIVKSKNNKKLNSACEALSSLAKLYIQNV